MSKLARRGDRRLVSIRRAMSERVTAGPEGTSRANTVQARMRPPAIQAKVNMEPLRIADDGRQKVSRPIWANLIDDGANQSNAYQTIVWPGGFANGLQTRCAASSSGVRRRYGVGLSKWL